MSKYNPERDDKSIESFFDSEVGKAFLEKESKKIKIKKGRYLRFEEWLKHNDFDKVMYRLILEHDDEYCEKCNHNGFETYPNNKLGFVIDYVVDNIEPINVPELDNDFPNCIWLFNGYYFQITYGQGSVIDIYNEDDKKHLLHV
jgi:hypothetical protein